MASSTTSSSTSASSAKTHYCLSPPSLILLLLFYILIKTVPAHFSLVTTKLVFSLDLTPSMATVTLLALGNGAPDVFSSVAAVRTGQYGTGFGAILSAGKFVVGLVAIYAAPFSLNPVPFVRDVLFYLTAALFLFYVYLSAKIYLWQAVGFVGFYLFFVGLVFWMDFGLGGGGKKSRVEVGLVGDCEMQRGSLVPYAGIGHVSESSEDGKRSFRYRRALGMISKAWELPVSFLLKLTIPQAAPSEWRRFYSSANIALCPLALLYACNSFHHPVVFLLSDTHLPLWFVILLATSSLALLHYAVEKEPPKTEQLPVLLIAFVMSVFWISTTAGELLNCLAALETLLELPPALLGLTVLAWGNSVSLLSRLRMSLLPRQATLQWPWLGVLLGQCLTCLLDLGQLWLCRHTMFIPRRTSFSSSGYSDCICFLASEPDGVSIGDYMVQIPGA